MRTFAIACFGVGLYVLPARATIYTDGLLMEPENQSIQEVRELQRRLDRAAADERQHEVRIAALIGLGVVVAGFAFRHFRRRG